MANYFDKFDNQESNRNFFDRFDSPTKNDDSATEPQKSGLIRRAVGDTAVSLGKGVIGAGEAVVGAANLITGGHAGKALDENIGYRPQQAKEMLEEYYSPEQQEANRKVQEAEGFVGTVGAAIQNPSVIAQTAVEL